MKYRKKPIEIEAIEFTGQTPYPDGVSGLYVDPVGNKHWHIEIDHKMVLGLDFKAYIETLEGFMEVRKGDYVITGIRGEKYPCKPDIFKETYEPVAAPSPN